MSTPSDSPHKNNVYDVNRVYDPDFTVEISNRMRVPDKISAHPDVEISADQRDRLTSGHVGKGSVDWMHVPDRILLVGGDRHVSGREQLPEMKLESSIFEDDQITSNSIQLMTPPRNLTLNDHQYPSVEPEDEQAVLKARNQSIRTKDVSFASVLS